MVAVPADRVVVELEARTRRHDAEIRTSTRRFQQNMRNIQQSAGVAERSSSASFRRIGAAVKILAAGLVVRQIGRYADAWTTAGNKIAAAAVVAGRQARSLSDLNDIATETRSEVTGIVDLYAKLLRATAGVAESEEEVARATEIVAKAFKAGGAAASEQAAGILQLGQALGSGVLQGDELRSLRENAPLIAQAIANEFETTIGGLKDLGEQGALTSDRVFKAILAAQADIENAFDATSATIGEGVTLVGNAFLELLGAFDDGARASENINSILGGVAGGLRDIAPAAERFGAQMREALVIVGEGFTAVTADLAALAEDFNLTSAEVSSVASAMVTATIEAFRQVVGAAGGTISAIQQAVQNAVAAVATAGVAIANTAASAIEQLLNAILRGVNALSAEINDVIRSANEISPVAIPLIPTVDEVSLGRVSSDLSDLGGSVGDAFDQGFDRATAGLDDLGASVASVINRITAAGDAAAARSGEIANSGLGGSGGASRPSNTSGGRGRGRSSGNSDEAVKENERVEKSITSLEDRLNSFSDASKSALSGFISDLRAGRDATEALGNALGRLSDSILNTALDAAFSGIFGSLGGVLGGSAAGKAGAGSTALKAVSLFGFADGGIARSGRPIKGFSRGGVSDTAAIFGEGPLPEAAVPLPDGRTIPVTIRMPRDAGPRQQSAPMGSGLERMPDINVVTPNADPRQVAEQVRTVMREELAGRNRAISQRGIR